MNDAQILTASLIEDTLQSNQAYKKIEEGLYVVKQGSAYVMINILLADNGRAFVSCVAQVVAGVEMNGDLAVELLERNSKTRMGAWAYERSGGLILFRHTILGGQTLDAAELMATLSDVALVADEADDQLVERHGGQRMKDLVEESALKKIVETYAN